jgi:hypothetical protein
MSASYDTPRMCLKRNPQFRTLVAAGNSIDTLHREIGGDESCSRSTVARMRREILIELAEENALREYPSKPQPDTDIVPIYDTDFADNRVCEDMGFEEVDLDFEIEEFSPGVEAPSADNRFSTDIPNETRPKQR